MIKVTTHESADAALAYMNQPENLAPFNEYMAQVKAKAEEGLSPDDLATFRLWWGGGSIDWNAVGTGPAYGAIMEAISSGCG